MRKSTKIILKNKQMGSLVDMNRLALKDTSFANLINKRIFNILLTATKYDVFMLEEDGRIDEQIFNEYTSLSLSSPPRFTQSIDIRGSFG